MKVAANARNLSISAQKLRLVADTVRGARAEAAMQQLAYMPQKAAIMVFDALKSAVANAEHNYNINVNTLVIETITVDQGTKLNRWRPRSKGMAAPRIHPSAHLKVIVAEMQKPEPEVATKAAKTTKKEEKK